MGSRKSPSCSRRRLRPSCRLWLHKNYLSSRRQGMGRARQCLGKWQGIQEISFLCRSVRGRCTAKRSHCPKCGNLLWIWFPICVWQRSLGWRAIQALKRRFLQAKNHRKVLYGSWHSVVPSPLRNFYSSQCLNSQPRTGRRIEDWRSSSYSVSDDLVPNGLQPKLTRQHLLLEWNRIW